MDSNVLVMFPVNEGQRLLMTLDDISFDCRAVFWYHLSELETWRLMIASPIVDDQGSRAAYRAINTALRSKEPQIDLSLGDISAISPKEELVRALRMAVHIDRNDPPKRISRQVIDGVFVEESYIYRML